MTGSRQPIVGLVARRTNATAAQRWPRLSHNLCLPMSRAWQTPGKTIGKIVPVAGVEQHVVAIAARQDAEAVVLDLVDPDRTGRWLFRRFRQANRYAEGPGTAQRQGRMRSSWSCLKGRLWAPSFLRSGLFDTGTASR